MNLSRPTEVRALLKEMDFHPSKALGQNFLTDGNIVDIIIDSANIQAEDMVLEVGPGLGVLTEALAANAKQVLAIEMDKRLSGHLVDFFASTPNIRIHTGDALDFDFGAATKDGYTKFVSNLPYSVGSRVLVELLQLTEPPEVIVVTVQKDVGDRLKAPLGTKNYGLLSIWAQAGYKVVIRKIVSPSCFTPAPRVTSSVVVLSHRKDAPSILNQAHFSSLIKTCFEKRRKQVGTILKDSPRFIPTGTEMEGLLNMIGITASMRPEEIGVEQWVALSNAVSPDISF